MQLSFDLEDSIGNLMSTSITYTNARKVAILPPGLQARKEIFESHLGNKIANDVDVELLAKSSAGIDYETMNG